MNIDFDDEKQQESTPTTPVNSPQINNPALSPSTTEIINPQPVKLSSKEEKELLVPPEIKTNYCLHHYDPETVQKIVLDIATTNDPIDDIIVKHGLPKTTVYLWRSISPQLLNAWRAAQRHRTHVIADKFEGEAETLGDQVENENDYHKNSNRIRRFDRVWDKRQWFMERHNRQDYGAKVENDIHLDISPAKKRDEAYAAHQSDTPPVDAEFEVLTVPTTLNKANIDTGNS